MCPTLHNIARTKQSNVPTGEKSLVENIEVDGRMILKRTINQAYNVRINVTLRRLHVKIVVVEKGKYNIF